MERDRCTVLKRLGKFEIRGVLGKGGQSTVFLAYDPQLQREVAIKLLRLARSRARSDLLDEARTAGRLRHPNIVTVYEAGEEGDAPYIVFEHVDGPSLAQIIRDHGAMEPARAANLMIGILDAIAHAHSAGIVHRDLKPSNVLLDRDGRPRVMDFGIAMRVGGATDGDALQGTPAYMAPEYIADRVVAPSNDIFAAGLCLYEMVFGRRAIEASNDFEALHRIASEPLVFPPDAFDRADEVVIDLIAKATARDPALRYASAAQMQQGLKAYLRPAVASADVNTRPSAASGTLEFLLRRMQHRSDFPSMSAAMIAVNRLAQSDQGDASRLSALILRDFALTNKLLRVANSAHHNSGRTGTVSTVSRAIVVLGFDAVRNLALSLLLFERLQDKKHAEALKEEFLRASMTGALARELGTQVGGCGAEEYFVCAIFHNLGRLLAHYYLREEALAVEKLVAHEEAGEELASRRVLGIGYRDLGIGVARSWGFPDNIVQSMVALPPSRRAPASASERLRLVSAVSDQLCRVIEHAPAEERPARISRLMKAHEAALPIEDRVLRGVVDRSLKAAAEMAAALRLDRRQSPLGRVLAAPEEQGRTSSTATGAASSVGGQGAEAEVSAAASPAGVDARAVLAAGIQDLSQGLIEELPQADLLRIATETTYRAFGFRRVLLCLRDEREPCLVARHAFGPEADLPWDRFRVSVHGNDLFSLMIARGADLLIHDAAEAKVRERLPKWYLDGFYARSFLVMPMRRGDTPVGLLYADQDGPAGIKISESEFALLRTLRNQAVLAIRGGR